MIVPTRFGLKYAPIPTLALEYEEDLNTVDDPDGDTSLYVYRDASEQRIHKLKKLHVMELPMLTKTSETMKIVHQLQQDNRRFLAPTIVKEEQLKRLLERLLDHLQVPEPSRVLTYEQAEQSDKSSSSFAARTITDKNPHSDDEEERGEEEEDNELDESALEESIADVSVSMEVSKTYDDDDGHKVKHSDEAEPLLDAEHHNLKSTSDDESGFEHNEAQRETINLNIRIPQEQEQANNAESSVTPAPNYTEDEEDEDDAAKKKALKSESEISDEDIQSEELEYFSEDASDEDSF